MVFSVKIQVPLDIGNMQTYQHNSTQYKYPQKYSIILSQWNNSFDMTFLCLVIVFHCFRSWSFLPDFGNTGLLCKKSWSSWINHSENSCFLCRCWYLQKCFCPSTSWGHGLVLPCKQSVVSKATTCWYLLAFLGDLSFPGLAYFVRGNRITASASVGILFFISAFSIQMRLSFFFLFFSPYWHRYLAFPT